MLSLNPGSSVPAFKNYKDHKIPLINARPCMPQSLVCLSSLLHIKVKGKKETTVSLADFELYRM